MLAGAWGSEVFRQTALIVLAILFLSGLIMYFLKNKGHYFYISWFSIKSWLFFAPILFIFFGLPAPWPLVFLTLIAIYGSKVFFQMMGMYHRSYFVIVTYLGIIGLAFTVQAGNRYLYNLVPMVVLLGLCLIPLARNNYKSMIQYISLANLAFVFLGWSFMHLGLLMELEKGIYQLMYLIILTEFCDNTNLAIARSVGKWKLFDRIDRKRTVESTLVAGALTVLLAFAMRHLLPDGSDKYWLSAGVVASLGGLLGDYVMTVIRRDAGIKVVGAFIWGRGDFLHRMDRLIFVAPIYFHWMAYLSSQGGQ